jgi:nucleoside-diphosphate-sugar epimerase
MARILLTGATGFLGTRLAARLSGHELWALTRRKPAEASGGCRWLLQDLAADHWEVELPDRIDTVIHLAQSPNYRNFPEAAAEIFSVGAQATLRLADWAVRAGANRFILASTGGLYGSSDDPVSEDAQLVEERGPLGFYFATKRTSELIATQYATRLSAFILRFFFIYGSGQPRQMLMPRLVDSVREERPINLQGSDGIRINPIHVDDASRAVERCLELNRGETVNIAGPEAASLRYIAERIGSELGREPKFAVDPASKPRHLVADISRMRSLLSPPVVNVADGIRELCSAPAKDRLSA